MEDETLPPEALNLYAKSREEHKDMDNPTAHTYALKSLRLAGWYKGVAGWKQLAPDVREKVNVRNAVKQPDGKYMIENVPVFYPNEVKENPEQHFTSQDIDEVVHNTNKMITGGSQRPGLTEGHVSPLRLAVSGEAKTFGFGINWRRDGQFATCDLVDVDASAVANLRDKKLTGLSVGFAWDANQTNRRIGHIAMLGGDIQALSSLPTVEIYASEGQVCFAAENNSSIKPWEPDIAGEGMHRSKPHGQYQIHTGGDMGKKFALGYKAKNTSEVLHLGTHKDTVGAMNHAELHHISRASGGHGTSSPGEQFPTSRGFAMELSTAATLAGQFAASNELGPIYWGSSESESGSTGHTPHGKYSVRKENSGKHSVYYSGKNYGQHLGYHPSESAAQSAAENHHSRQITDWQNGRPVYKKNMNEKGLSNYSFAASSGGGPVPPAAYAAKGTVTQYDESGDPSEKWKPTKATSRSDFEDRHHVRREKHGTYHVEKDDYGDVEMNYVPKLKAGQRYILQGPHTHSTVWDAMHHANAHHAEILRTGKRPKSEEDFSAHTFSFSRASTVASAFASQH